MPLPSAVVDGKIGDSCSDMASKGCFQVPLSIGRHVFPSDLIILESQGLDVILGMDWLSMYGGNIDCASKSILLTTPEGRRIKYVS